LFFRIGASSLRGWPKVDCREDTLPHATEIDFTRCACYTLLQHRSTTRLKSKSDTGDVHHLHRSEFVCTLVSRVAVVVHNSQSYSAHSSGKVKPRPFYPCTTSQYPCTAKRQRVTATGDPLKQLSLLNLKHN